MLGDIFGATNIYIITGYTDMRKSVDGLCAIVMNQLKKYSMATPYIFSVVKLATGKRIKNFGIIIVVTLIKS